MQCKMLKLRKKPKPKKENNNFPMLELFHRRKLKKLKKENLRVIEIHHLVPSL